ncbi:hypothetical protein L9F63_013348, partial [Diploptera punctata]
WVWCSCSPDLDSSQCWRVGFVGADMVVGTSTRRWKQTLVLMSDWSWSGKRGNELRTRVNTTCARVPDTPCCTTLTTS